MDETTNHTPLTDEIPADAPMLDAHPPESESAGSISELDSDASEAAAAIPESEAVTLGEGRSSRRRASSLRSLFAPREGVGLDIADDVVSIVRIRRQGRDFKVLQSGSASIRHPTPGSPPGAHRAALAAAIKEAMTDACIRTRKVIVNLPGDPAECTVRTLPAMPVGELEAVLRREGAKLYGPDTAWDYVALSEKGHETQSVLTAYAPAGKVAECINVLKDCGLAASAISTSHTALLTMTRRLVKDDESAALVHFGTQAASVVILTNSVPVLVRRIQLDDTTDSSPEYVAQEITRTFLYFKQKCRGKRVTKLIQWGASDEVLALLNGMNDITVDDFAALPLEGGETQGLFSPVAAGLAIMATTGVEVNLLPDDVKGRRERGVKVAAMLAAAMAVCVIYGACYLALFAAEGMYREALADSCTQAECFEPLRREHEAILALKGKLRHRRDLHVRLMERSLPWPYMLWAIGKVTPPGVDLTEVAATREIEEGAVIWRLKLSGQLLVEGDRRHRVLRQLLDRLEQCGLFASVQLEPLHENSVGGAMAFCVRCEILPPREWMS